MSVDPAHQWIRARHRHDRQRLLTRETALPVLAAVDAHRRLRGPYTAAGTILRAVVPEALRRSPGLVAAHEIEILTAAPELRDRVPSTRETLTSLAVPRERTRFYSRLRTRRVAHGLTEFLHAYVRGLGAGPHLLLVDDVHLADPTDQELFAVLLRRADPALLRLRLATGTGAPVTAPEPLAEPLVPALERYAATVTGSATPLPPPPGDPAARYVEGDCVDDDPRLAEAYERLAPEARAALHDARAEALEALGEPSLLLGAVPYHREHGGDLRAGVQAVRHALETCLDMGFYHATVDLGERGRALVDWKRSPSHRWAFTTKVTTSLAALGRPEEAFPFYDEIRASTDHPRLHLQAAYATSMLYTRHLPRERQDHAAARMWAHTAVAFAQWIPDAKERAFETAFNRNGLALVSVHEGDLEQALELVDDGITRLDATLHDDEHRLHRSVLRHNRSQVYLALGRHEEALADLDHVVAADPNYPEYHFDRGNLLRRLGHNEEALVSYERALALSPPFPEVVYNRADTLLELGDADGALAGFSYAITLAPEFTDAYANRASLLLDADRPDAALHDVTTGLALDPAHPHLRCLRAQLLLETDPDTAQAELDALVATHPDFAAGWAARASAAYDRGDLDAAVADYDRALGLGDDPSVRFNRALAHLGAGRYPQALADLTAVHDATGDPDAAAFLARVRHHMAAAAPTG